MMMTMKRPHAKKRQCGEKRDNMRREKIDDI
jgi:hypothetical protein